MNKAMGMLVMAAGLSAVAGANEVFSWQDGRGVVTYSDVPRSLKPEHSNVVNVQTQTLTQTVPPAASAPAALPEGSIADQQWQLSRQVAERNKSIETQNQQIEARNRQQKDDNCKAARLNRSIAEGARVNSREALLARYDADVRKYCD